MQLAGDVEDPNQAICVPPFATDLVVYFHCGNAGRMAAHPRRFSTIVFSYVALQPDVVEFADQIVQESHCFRTCSRKCQCQCQCQCQCLDAVWRACSGGRRWTKRKLHLQIDIYKTLHLGPCRSCRKNQKVPTMLLRPVRSPANRYHQWNVGPVKMPCYRRGQSIWNQIKSIKPSKKKIQMIAQVPAERVFKIFSKVRLLQLPVVIDPQVLLVQHPWKWDIVEWYSKCWSIRLCHTWRFVCHSHPSNHFLPLGMHFSNHAMDTAKQQQLLFLQPTGRWWGRGHLKKRAIDPGGWPGKTQPCFNGREKRHIAQKKKQKTNIKKKKTVEKRKKKNLSKLDCAYLDAASIKTALVVGFLCPFVDPRPISSERGGPASMHIVICALLCVIFFSEMDHTPIEVDLTNDTPPHWTTDGASTPPTAPAPYPACAICLRDITSAAGGSDAPYEWPCCNHPLHLQCAMQHVSHQAHPVCPTCRQQWTREGEQSLEEARTMHRVPWMVPDTPHDTRASHTEAPPAPSHLIPLCCPRLILVDHHHPERDASWRELPARHMDWAPHLNQNHATMGTRVGLPPVQQHDHTRSAFHATRWPGATLPNTRSTQLGRRPSAKWTRVGL